MKALALALTVLALGAAVLVPATPQPLSYHTFADCREVLGLPNALNVLSNLPFLWAGALGLRLAADADRGGFLRAEERLPYLVFFLGAALTCFGSIWYHLAPDNPRLVWDRLPMTIAFSGLVAASVAERIDARLGRQALWPLVAIGAISVYYWYATERAGAGNLVPYGAFQAWAIAMTLLAAFASRSSVYSHAGMLWWAVALYGLAKVFETFDLGVYRLSGAWLSGHTIKHLLAAWAVYVVYRMLRDRQPQVDTTALAPSVRSA